jgi:hypothetical protein
MCVLDNSQRKYLSHLVRNSQFHYTSVFCNVFIEREWIFRGEVPLRKYVQCGFLSKARIIFNVLDKISPPPWYTHISQGRISHSNLETYQPRRVWSHLSPVLETLTPFFHSVFEFMARFYVRCFLHSVSLVFLQVTFVSLRISKQNAGKCQSPHFMNFPFECI